MVAAVNTRKIRIQNHDLDPNPNLNHNHGRTTDIYPRTLRADNVSNNNYSL